MNTPKTIAKTIGIGIVATLAAITMTACGSQSSSSPTSSPTEMHPSGFGTYTAPASKDAEAKILGLYDSTDGKLAILIQPDGKCLISKPVNGVLHQPSPDSQYNDSQGCSWTLSGTSDLGINAFSAGWVTTTADGNTIVVKSTSPFPFGNGNFVKQAS
jgi:hypothetical protein